ncbi:hypothetical protein DRQ25_16755 [Candidatus Fermentibacteria bacterium]|nr:MAG: hypothetical protein DRQ25_16755 [Candidatus Fermentibacteria bacterium]
MERITQKDLEALTERINILTDNPKDTFDKTESKTRFNIGNYHLSYAYGGVALHQTTNIHGGVSDIFNYHMPKRDLYNRMHAYLMGLYDGKGV